MKNQDVGWKSSCNCIDIMYPCSSSKTIVMHSLALAPKLPGADPDLHSHCHELAALEINKQSWSVPCQKFGTRYTTFLVSPGTNFWLGTVIVPSQNGSAMQPNALSSPPSCVRLNLRCTRYQQTFNFNGTMNLSSQVPQFDPLLCCNSFHDQCDRPFTPVGHDIIVIDQDGQPRIARNASAAEMIGVLQRCNRRCASDRDGAKDDTATLTIM